MSRSGEEPVEESDVFGWGSSQSVRRFLLGKVVNRDLSSARALFDSKEYSIRLERLNALGFGKQFPFRDVTGKSIQKEILQ